MPLPLISDDMFFVTVLKAIEQTLKDESDNQILLGGTGWQTVRERFSPWNVTTDEFHPGVVNVVWSSSSYPGDEATQFFSVSDTSFAIDCYASNIGKEEGGGITPSDQRAADVLHGLVTKIFYTITSPINIDLGLTPGSIVKPFVSSMVKFVPSETNVPVAGVIAARLSCNTKIQEVPPEATGVDLEIINVKANRDDSVPLVENTFEY